MKRSDINSLIRSAKACFEAHGWTLPPVPRWDVTDFGLGDWQAHGLVLVNLAEHPEYCEKVMFARKGMNTPAHCHKIKKEDIICRWGRLQIQLWPGHPASSEGQPLTLLVDNVRREVKGGECIILDAGQRVTLVPGVWHEFAPVSDECIIGEVSTANNDAQDNFFANPDVGRFPDVHEDEPAIVKLVSDGLDCDATKRPQSDADT